MNESIESHNEGEQTLAGEKIIKALSECMEKSGDNYEMDKTLELFRQFDYSWITPEIEDYVVNRLYMDSKKLNNTFAKDAAWEDIPPDKNALIDILSKLKILTQK